MIRRRHRDGLGHNVCIFVVRSRELQSAYRDSGCCQCILPRMYAVQKDHHPGHHGSYAEVVLGPASGYSRLFPDSHAPLPVVFAKLKMAGL